MSPKKNIKSIDAASVKEYLLFREEIIEDLKNKGLILAGEHGGCLHIEIDANPEKNSAKLSIKEYF